MVNIQAHSARLIRAELGFESLALKEPSAPQPVYPNLRAKLFPIVAAGLGPASAAL